MALFEPKEEMKPERFEDQVKIHIGAQFSKFLQQLDSQLLLGIMPQNILMELSFYNFSNAITACFFTDRQLKVQAVNPTFQKLFSSQGPLEGRSLTRLFAELGIAPAAIEDFKAQLQEKRFAQIPQIEIVKEGSTRYYSLFSTFTQFKKQRSLYGIQGQFIDRTQEVLLKKRQDALAGQIRHDMKNRIAASMMGSQAALAEWGFLKNSVSLPPEMADFMENLITSLEEIQSNSDYLNKLVLQMLDVSKLQAGSLSLKPSRFDLNGALTQVFSALRPQQTARGLQVSQPEAPFEIEADFVQISRVLENYHSNAIKYAKNSIFWSIEAQGESVLVRVADDGEGIPQEYLTRIFDPFFQVPGKDKAGSTGLGLDSVRELVNLHGGETWAESEGPGLGSRFHIRLPLTQAKGTHGN
ncbi:MAG: hypothetical protein A2600_05850 [Candidatus Lambdaproteobacteria bacterium RIFOXYD1_FULL_56_27]|nr:MAG: hypothetical protein A2426_01530 [Candidatus Lambdaproteobacteria bacterium RIFOXYC1_FULL_56_13]OGH09807.1 MAG: hypothetical protein A2600_05850 [Candidatus Lambdaproteobacteria bacterium RIFOXYD1_FULL_56_27]